MSLDVPKHFFFFFNLSSLLMNLKFHPPPLGECNMHPPQEPPKTPGKDSIAHSAAGKTTWTTHLQVGGDHLVGG